MIACEHSHSNMICCKEPPRTVSFCRIRMTVSDARVLALLGSCPFRRVSFYFKSAGTLLFQTISLVRPFDFSPFAKSHAAAVPTG